MGVLALAWGGIYVGNNLLDDPWDSIPGDLLGIAATFSALVLVASWAREDGPRCKTPLVGVSIIVLLDVVVGVRSALGADPGVGILGFFPDLPGTSRVALDAALNPMSTEVVAWCAAYLCLRALFAEAPARRDAATALGLGLFIFYAGLADIVYAEPDRVLDALEIGRAIVLTSLLAGPWLVAASRGGGRSALLASFAFLTVGLAGLLVPYLAKVPQDDVAIDPTGVRGIMRTLAWAALVYGILRHDLLGIGLKPKTVDRSAIAAGALASLFIVAQIAQNFLSTEYGLLTGGLVAGAFLFAAQPIQRAIERLADRQPTIARGEAWQSARSGTRDPREAAYSAAVRAALNDGAMNAEEELHLAEVAQHLGIGALDALRIRREVEREPRSDV